MVESSVEERYAAVVGALVEDVRVRVGSARRGFGATGLQVNDRIFAMLSSRGEYVLKLPARRVDQLVAEGAGERFEAGRGRAMKEWLAVDPEADVDWIGLAREALAYVGGLA